MRGDRSEKTKVSLAYAGDTLRLLNIEHRYARDTPTYVGKTNGQNDIAARVWKHPHVRGEDQRAE